MMGIKLTNQQNQVLDKIKAFIESDASVFILRGYAGTGKTTMVKHIADYISQIRSLSLMAPTGRAARVLEMKTGYHASTIHKAIYGKASLLSKEVKDIADVEFKLCFPINTTDGKIVAIVDEASMLCSKKMEQELYRFGTDNLMEDLLTFVRPSYGGKVIFVGDPAQLPPVGESESQALNETFFTEKGLKVMSEELTEVLRQTGESVILKNAMKIRDLLDKQKRNRLVFEERAGDVVSISAEELLDKYLCEKKNNETNDCIVICFSNQTAFEYNKEIRENLYHESDPELKVGDVLMVVQNNYQLDRMNGEFVPVLYVGEIIQQSAPVYVQEGGVKVRKVITLNFQRVRVTDPSDNPRNCMILLDLLNNGTADLGIDKKRALFINFCMRHPSLKPGSEEFARAIEEDCYYNCLKAKYGYAVTGHKCQGGEWKKVFVDYSGRTGLSNDCLRWAYTATTRAKETLYIFNLPHITPFSKFRIEQVQQSSKMNEECRIIGHVACSPFHKDSDPNYLHAKCRCIMTNMEYTPYHIDKIVSNLYQEVYYITTPDGVECYDLRYRKGGLFLKAVPRKPSRHNVLVNMMLDDERAMPFVFSYVPTDKIHENLYNLIRSACDELSIQITNVVEHKEDYSVVYYFRTSGTISYLKIYINDMDSVTYAKPMSLLGQEDKELILLLQIIQEHFE